MGKERLKDGMPRLYPDHRSTVAKAFRRDWERIVEGLDLNSRGRMQAALLVDAWRDFVAVRAECERVTHNRKRSAQDRERIRRRKAKVAGYVLMALRSLQDIAGKNGDTGELDLAALFHQPEPEKP